jgi:hypothetical protein
MANSTYFPEKKLKKYKTKWLAYRLSSRIFKQRDLVKYKIPDDSKTIHELYTKFPFKEPPPKYTMMLCQMCCRY